MLKRRLTQAGIVGSYSPHFFRASGMLSPMHIRFGSNLSSGVVSFKMEPNRKLICALLKEQGQAVSKAFRLRKS
jgi:hypothetical protein